MSDEKSTESANQHRLGFPLRAAPRCWSIMSSWKSVLFPVAEFPPGRPCLDLLEGIFERMHGSCDESEYTPVKEDPQYRASSSNGSVDIFSPMACEDRSNLLNKIVKDFSVTEMETRLADFQPFCAVQAARCAGSLAVGQWDPLRITLHMHNARVYEILNVIVAHNCRAIWTVTASNLASFPKCCGLWYICPLQEPFKSSVSERLIRMPQ